MNEPYQIEQRIKTDMYIIGAVFAGNIILRFLMMPFLMRIYLSLSGVETSVSSVYWFNIILSALLYFALPLIIFEYAFGNRKTLQLEDEKTFHISTLVPAFFAVHFAITLGGIITYKVAEFISGQPPENPFDFMLPENFSQTVAFYLYALFISPIAEELIYRKYLLTPLRKLGDIHAIIITSILFALAHGHIMQIFYAFLGGMVFGFIAVRNGGVKATIIIHILINALEFLREENERLSFFLLLIGLLSFINLIKNGYFNIKNNCPEIIQSRKIKLIYLNPLMLVGFLMLILTMQGL